MVYLVLKMLFLIIPVVKARQFTTQEYGKLPQLFHLDDYHECLSQDDGVYCLGAFYLTPLNDFHAVYNLMKEYSNDKFAFNRTLIHRGYCLNQHCPDTTSNATLRFERCIDKWAKDKGLHATLHTLEYCRNAGELRQHDTPQLVFVYAVLLIILLNIIGTVGDMANGDKNTAGFRTKIALWSIRANWNKLTTTMYVQKDPRLMALAPLQGARVLILSLVILSHSKFIHYMVYLQNPQDIEKDVAGLTTVFFTNGTTVVQIFVIFSSMLCAYNLLLSSEKTPLSFSSIPRHILKRTIRIAPVHLLLIGFGATWYAETRDGPLWPVLIEKEQEVCRKKFWTHALFINNLMEPEQKCYLQSWFLAIDMQMYVVSLLLTLYLARIGRRILKILMTMYFISLIFVTLLAYFYEWQSMLYISVPETMHAYFKSPSFERLYITPFGHISSCLVGLILAHLQYTIHERNIKVHHWKWLIYGHYYGIPIYIAWLLYGVNIRDTFTSQVAIAAYVGIERLVFNFVIGAVIFGTINIDTPLRRFFAWRGWDVFARLSLPVLMIHWAVNMTIVASRPTLTYSTFFDIIVDSSATWIITYSFAVPVAVMLEIPMQRLC